MKEDLIKAIQANDTASAKQLIESNPDLAKAEMDNGVSVLLLAAYYRNTELVNTLLIHKDKLSNFEAAATGQLEKLQSGINLENINSFAPDGFTALGLACFFGHSASAKFLVESGADVNIPSNNDFKVAPIHSATAIGRVDIVKLLLEYKADVNAQQQSGVTALHSAAHNNNIDLLKVLLANGADKSLQMNDGTTALQMAEKDRHAEVVKLLS